MRIIPREVGWKRFFSELRKEIAQDQIATGAAALAYYLTLAIFPALILVLSVVPLLPIADVDTAIMDWLRQVLPADTASLVRDIVQSITTAREGSLISLGTIGTVWAASSGTHAVMQQLNITYDVREGRSFFKSRAIALGLTVLLGVLMMTAFLLVVLGGIIQDWLITQLGSSSVLVTGFAILRWIIIVTAMLLAFALAYYFGPDVEQKFHFVTPGSLLGTPVLIGASLGFRAYVSNFGNYNATYGSIGAVIVLMLWLYISGLVFLLGSEINALIEHSWKVPVDFQETPLA